MKQRYKYDLPQASLDITYSNQTTVQNENTSSSFFF